MRLGYWLLLSIAPSIWLVGWGSVCAQSDSLDQPSAEKPKFPYQAIVLAEQAEVRSGPDAVHYPTDRLPQGAVVEVYRHDPGGWCAIRPPRGSFSLIPEGGLVVDDDSVGRIVEDGVQAWVGTRLDPVERPLWQVKLRAGERVQVLGQVSWPAPEGHSVIWYQIAPPPGEFRWIHISDLQLPDDWTDLPEATDRGSEDEPDSNGLPPGRSDYLLAHVPDSPGWETDREDRGSQIPDRRPEREGAVHVANLDQSIDASRDEDVLPATFQQPSPHSSSPAQNTNRGWRRATRPIRLVGADAPIESGGRSSNESDPLFDLPLHSGSADMPFDSFTQRTPKGKGGPEGNRGLEGERVFAESMRADRAVRVADRSPAIPDIDRQQFRTEQATRGGSSGAALEWPERRLLPPLGTLSERLTQLELMLTQELLQPLGRWRLESIEKYARSIQAEPLGPDEQVQVERLLMKLADCQQLQRRTADLEQGMPLESRAAIGSGVDTSVKLGTTYDAYGWLNELVQANGTQPSTYVLQDDNGKIIFHISPSPGLNLHRYLKQKVGIIGQRGYHKRYRLDHVTAERVIVLQNAQR